MNHRLREKLPRMPTKQGISAPTLRTVLPARIAICTLAVNGNGLYHGAPDVGRMQPVVGGHQQVHQDGALPPPKRGWENGDGPGGHLRKRGMEIPRAAY